MDAFDPVSFARWHIALFLALLAASVGAQMLTGRIRTRGLLRDKVTGRLSPGRVQLLVVTLSGAAAYFAQAVGAPESLPPIDIELLAALGGSNALYLAGKAGSKFNLWSKLLDKR